MKNVMKYIEYYCENDAKELDKMVDGIVKGFGGIYQKDLDDFYSVGLLALTQIWENNSWNGVDDFASYLYGVLYNKIRNEITTRNAGKRNNIKIVIKDGEKVEEKLKDISIYEPITEDGLTLENTLVSKKTVEDEIFQDDFNNKMESYLNKLSRTEKKIVSFLCNGYKSQEIQKALNIGATELRSYMNDIRAYENVSVLY